MPLLFFLLLQLLATTAFSTKDALVPMETDITDIHHSTSSSWKLKSRTPSNTILHFTAALKIQPANAITLERIFYEVSDPKHSNYGQYWSQSKMSNLLSPFPHHLKLMKKWIKQYNTTMNFTNELVSFSLTAAQAEMAFHTEFFAHQHQIHASVVLHRAPQGYSLPFDVAAAVNTIDGITRLPYLSTPSTFITQQQPHVGGTGGTGGPFPDTCSGKCSGRVTPAILSERYQMGDPPTDPHKNSSMAVAEFQNQGWDQKDCDKLAAACNTQNITVNTQIPANKPTGGPSTEALLDIQYIKSLGGSIPLTNIYSTEYSLLNWAKVLSSLQNPPLVNSVSYGNDENQQTGVAYMESCNVQFKALGVRGLSILFASGDQGVCDRFNLFIEPQHSCY